MTREEILAMPAGRELDALVAEKVMGTELQWDEEERQSYRLAESPFGEILNPFNPSTDISAAMEVEANIMKMEWHIQHKYLLTLHQITGSYGEINLKDIFSMMQAPPVDRCKAALIAVMEGQANEN